MKKIDVRTVVYAVIIIVGLFIIYKLWTGNITSDYHCAKCGGCYQVVEYVTERRSSGNSTKAIIECKDCGNVFKVGLYEASKIEQMAHADELQ